MAEVKKKFSARPRRTVPFAGNWKYCGGTGRRYLNAVRYFRHTWRRVVGSN